ncbi:hypothetical protein [Corynebacterium pyruviciproducens]|uniref:hypothetical protein n=1 Tax=Corynebacterium pyruviciproducens TaxID=598660 RepID=UPI00254B2AA5|nr:hypothetical protein [Corynebacterium pyruviciproducens]MDK7215211.1 hypothetical protein [Corynebacterium pyruviciproducens]
MSTPRWQTRALRPVMAWFVVVLLLAVTRLPLSESRWLIIHALALGAVTTSIVFWSQHFTDKFLRLSTPGRSYEWRSYALTAFIVVMFVAQAGGWLPLLAVGAAGVAGVLIYHAVRLTAQYRAAGQRRFSSSVAGYIAAALCLPCGAVAGTYLQARGTDGFRWAHVVLTVLGFVGITALSTLALMVPMVWRTQMKSSHTGVSIALLVAGVIVALTPLKVVGLSIYLCGWLWAAYGWAREIATVLKDPRDRVGYAALSMACAIVWLIVALCYYIVQHARIGESAPIPTAWLLVGFVGQLLVGAMSFLLPSRMGGGPGAVRAGMYAHNRGAYLRVTLTNLGLAVGSPYALTLAVAALAMCLPAQFVSYREQKAVKEKVVAAPEPARYTPWGQVFAGVAVLCAVGVLTM